jgi:hypothetical protein
MFVSLASSSSSLLRVNLVISGGSSRFLHLLIPLERCTFRDDWKTRWETQRKRWSCVRTPKDTQNVSHTESQSLESSHDLERNVEKSGSKRMRRSQSLLVRNYRLFQNLQETEMGTTNEWKVSSYERWFGRRRWEELKTLDRGFRVYSLQGIPETGNRERRSRRRRWRTAWR